jgi:hypothetical protein
VPRATDLPVILSRISIFTSLSIVLTRDCRIAASRSNFSLDPIYSRALVEEAIPQVELSRNQSRANSHDMDDETCLVVSLTNCWE